MNGDLSYCFMCGERNPRGLHLKKEIVDGKPSMRLDVDKYLCGFSGILHGGITAGMLDEVMCFAGAKLGPMVTIKMSVKYISPGLEGHHLVAEGQIDQDLEKDVYASAILRDLDTGKLVAKAEGIYRKVPAEVVFPRPSEEKAEI